MFDAMTMTRKMQDVWGINLDWHEMSDALEYLANIGEIDRDGFNAERMEQYC
jgi:hypothetical protein